MGLYLYTGPLLAFPGCVKLGLGVSCFRLRLHGSPSAPMSEPERDEGHSGPQQTICMSSIRGDSGRLPLKETGRRGRIVATMVSRVMR